MPSDNRWDPRFGLPNVAHDVYALALADNGALFIGGAFPGNASALGYGAANFIAEWNGRTWLPLGNLATNGVSGSVQAIALSGTNIFVGGWFGAANDVALGEYGVNFIARWDGDHWSRLGTATDFGVEGQVYALAFHNGDLYVGGRFLSAGGVPATNVARWDGQQWSALGTGLGDPQTNSVTALVVADDGTVYAGGNFTVVGGVTLNRVARWTGASWQSVGGGLDGTVNALAIQAGQVYAGGAFNQAGGITASRLAQWDGTNWFEVGGGVSGGDVDALAFDGTNLYAGGSFTAANGVPASGIARWNGTLWSALGTGVQGGLAITTPAVYAIQVRQGILYAGGEFDYAGQALAPRAARWDGERWTALNEALMGGGQFQPTAVAVNRTNVYVGGDFFAAGGVLASNVARWDGSAWFALGQGSSNGVNGRVAALATSSNGAVYVGGEFTVAGGAAANRIAGWDGTNWFTLGAGIQPAQDLNLMAVRAAVVAADGSLYAGGDFTVAGSAAATNIARWDGVQWSALGPGLNGPVLTLAIDGNTLYAGGAFDHVGPLAANGVARWDGTSWSALGNGVAYPGYQPSVRALALWGGDLYAGGNFIQAGGVNASHLAQWDGHSWSPFGGGTDFNVNSLVIVSNQLFAGGEFTLVGGQNLDAVARWDGTNWVGLGSGLAGTLPSGGGNSPRVLQMAANGTDLYLAGSFMLAGGEPATGFADWTWNPAPPTSNDIPPSVSIVDLNSGIPPIAGSNVTVTAAANDPDGTIAQVDFYAGANLIGAAFTAPFTITWSNVPAGNFTLTAAATDNSGTTAVSPPLDVAVRQFDLPPSIDFITPQADEVFDQPTNILLSCTAADSDGQVVRVDFYTNNVLLATLPASSTYAFNWTDPPPGLYTVTATATDNGGQTSSATVRIVVAASTQAQVVYTNNFEGPIGHEWSSTNTDVTPVDGQRFLGQFGVRGVGLTLTNLPPHNSATLSFDLFVIGSWDGNNLTYGPDVWDLRVVGGPTLLHTTFDTQNHIDNRLAYQSQAFPGSYPGGEYPIDTGAREVNTLGFLWNWPGVMDAVYHLVFSFNHSASTLQVYFRGEMPSTSDDTWGLKNVQVSVDNLDPSTVPVFVRQPRSQMAPAGDNIALAAQTESLNPAQYQWQFNGTDLPGQTNAYLALTNLAATQAGSYAVVAANSSGFMTSHVAQIVVVDAPRRIQVVTEGANVTFNSSVAGADQAGYRWRCNDHELAGATNAALTLTGVTASQTGNYSVEVRTLIGTLRTPPFKLTVNAAINRPIYQTDFGDSLVGPEWSSSQRAVTPRDRRWALGFFGNAAVTLTLTNLPPHDEVNLSLDVLAVLSLDGNAAPPAGPDTWRAQVNGLPGSQFQTTFSGFHGGIQAYPGSYPGGSFPGRSGAAEIGTLGYQEWFGSIVDYPSGMNNLDAVYNVNLQFQHTNSTLQATFTGANQEGLWNEGWAIGNVVVSVAQVASNAPPQFTTEPVNQFARAGDPVVFQAGATVETPVSYQWTLNGQNLPGQTNAYFVLPSVQGSQAGEYWVTMANDYGTAGRPVHLSVLTRDPMGESVNAGDPAIFIAAAQPLDAHYQWRRSGVDLPGQTGTNLIVQNTTVADQGTYQALVSDGHSSLLTVAAGLTVAPSGQPGSVQWVFPEGSGSWSTPAIAPDGTVYVGDSSGDLYALSSPYGDLYWQLNLQGAVFSSPVVSADGTIYVVAGQTLYAVSRLGIVQWQRSGFAAGRPPTLPALGPGGMIYLTGGLDNNGTARLLQAINPDGSFRWTYTASGTTPSSPVLGEDGSIYFEVNNPYETVGLQTNGPVKWYASANNSFNASPAIGADGALYSCVAGGYVFALNPTNGVRRWTQDSAGMDLMMSSPVIDEEGVIYVGSDKGKLLAIAPDGTPLWAFPAGGPIRSTPALSAAGSIYFTAYDGKLYCVDRSGVEKWERVIGNPIPYVLENWFQGSPAIARDGTVYVTSHEGLLWRIKGDAGPAPSSWPQLHRDARHSGSLAYDPSNVSQLAVLKSSGGGPVNLQVMTTPKRYVDLFVSTDLRSWTWITNRYSATGILAFTLTPPAGQEEEFFRAAVP